MDETLKFLLKSAFESGYNRGLGAVAHPIVIDVQFNDWFEALSAETPLEDVMIIKKA